VSSIPLKDVRYIVIHCSATPPDMDIGVAEIDRWHRQKGYFKVGYHFIIRRDGTVEAGRNINEPGAHAQGYNSMSIGICLVGGVKRIADADGKPDADGPRWDLVPENNFTPEQMVALKALVGGLKHQHVQAEVLGHRDLPGVRKGCPSFDVRQWWVAVGAA